MPSRAEAEIRKELSPDECLLWSGRPRRAFDGRELGEMILHLAFIGFGLIYLVYPRWDFHLNWGDNLFLLFLIGLSSFWLLYFLVVSPWNRARQVYGLTNERVLYVHRGFGRRVEDLPLHTMRETNIWLTERDDLTGTIGFADFLQRCGYNDDDICMPEFFRVPDAASVTELVRKAIGAAPKPPETAMSRWLAG